MWTNVETTLAKWKETTAELPLGRNVVIRLTDGTAIKGVVKVAGKIHERTDPEGKTLYEATVTLEQHGKPLTSGAIIICSLGQIVSVDEI